MALFVLKKIVEWALLKGINIIEWVQKGVTFMNIGNTSFLFQIKEIKN